MASQAELRDNFIKKYPNLRYGLGEWRRYDTGIWGRIDELVVKNYVQTLVQRSDTKLSNGIVTSITELLRQRTYIPDSLFDANPNILIFNDRCLDLITYCEVPHAPEHYATSKLTFDYDPTARSDAWDNAVKLFPYPIFLQDYTGLCLTPETKYEVAVWLHGPPGGGKSTFIVGLEAMLGPKCCTLGLAEISNSKFGLAQIPGKTLAVSAEQPAAFIKCADRLNSLISGESTLVERKFHDAYAVIPRVKLLWAMNELPTIPAGSGAGLFRRIYPVFWPSLPEGERDPGIKEQIAKNGMAVVNWGLIGHKRFRERGSFDIPTDLRAARETYRVQSDVTLCFVEECYDLDDGDEIPANEIYANYRRWCEANDHRGALAANRFANDMERLGYRKVRRKIGVFYQGLTDKDPQSDYEIDQTLH